MRAGAGRVAQAAAGRAPAPAALHRSPKRPGPPTTTLPAPAHLHHARVDAHKGEGAHKGVGHDLEGQAGEGLLVGGLAGDLLRRRRRRAVDVQGRVRRVREGGQVGASPRLQ